MTGVTKISKEVLDTFTDEYGCTKDSIEMPIPRIVCMMPSMKDIRIYTSWLIDKQGLGKLYKEHDLMESLFPLTYSCEYYSRDKMYGDVGDKHCGKCWWCQEREWGFGKL